MVTEIVLIAAGVIIFALGYLLPARRRDVDDDIQLISEDEIRKIVDREMEDAKDRISGIVDETVTYTMEKTERSMERVTNEKIMAVNEYSDTVLDEINKNHKEVLFLYDMLNDKHENLKDTVSEANRTAEEVKQTVKDAEITAREAEAAARNAEITVREAEEAARNAMDTAYGAVGRKASREYNSVSEYERRTGYSRVSEYGEPAGYDSVPVQEESTGYGRMSAYENSVGYNRIPEREEPAEYDRMPETEKSFGSNRMPEAEESFEYSRMPEPEEPANYNRMPDLEEPVEYDRMPESEEISGHSMIPEYHEPAEYSKVSEQVRPAEYGRASQYERPMERGRISEWKETGKQSKTPEYDRVERRERVLTYDDRPEEKDEARQIENEVQQVIDEAFVPIAPPRVEIIHNPEGEYDYVAEPRQEESLRPKRREMRLSDEIRRNAEMPARQASARTAEPKSVNIQFANGRDNGKNNNERILELSRAGKSNMAIAKELGLGIGEVKLVIDLFDGMN